MSATFERVRALMVKEFHLDAGQVTPATCLTDLGVDSLAALEFVFELENEFAITLDNDTDLRGGVVQNVVDAVDLALLRLPTPVVHAAS